MTLPLASLMAPSTQHRMLCALLMEHSTLRLTFSGTAFLILKLICDSDIANLCIIRDVLANVGRVVEDDG